MLPACRSIVNVQEQNVLHMWTKQIQIETNSLGFCRRDDILVSILSVTAFVLTVEAVTCHMYFNFLREAICIVYNAELKIYERNLLTFTLKNTQREKKSQKVR